MHPGDVTKYVLLSTVIALTLFNVYMYLSYGVEATISVQVHAMCRSHPIIPFTMGVLLGHVLWPICEELVALLLRGR
jgi:hypothetical protein